MIERFESSKDPDDSKHADHANDADGYRYWAQRYQGQADHDQVQDIPAHQKELLKPVAEQIQSELNREQSRKNVVQDLQNTSVFGQGSIWILSFYLCLDGVCQEVLP